MQNSLLKICSLVLVLCGVVCLAVYYFAFMSNGLLAASLILEFVGILSYILINRYME
ncbi:MAG: hypothetical protein IJ756_00845 [Paludibacteraceae bacterium]|nr:hypothetical protein [Paludibacteraceae bacterium]